jgi:RNA-directed DNA polymerase
MSGKRQNNQNQLAFLFEEGSEAPGNETEGTETHRAERATESPAEEQRLMEVVVDRENLRAALQRVRANAGSPGIDGMTVDALPEYLQQHWPSIREQLLNGTYKPQAVQRVEIEKQDGSGMRKLGIPGQRRRT